MKLKWKPVLLGILIAALCVLWIASFAMMSGTKYNAAQLLDRDTSYFLEPGFEITPKNFSQCVEDLFAVPGKLFYSIGTNGSIEECYYCKNTVTNQEISKNFQDLSIVEDSWENFNDIWWNSYDIRAEFTNEAGALTVAVKGKKSYFCFEIHDLEPSPTYYDVGVEKRFCFITNQNLKDSLLEAENLLRPKSQSADPYME